jgi:hypothetical protein
MTETEGEQPESIEILDRILAEIDAEIRKRRRREQAKRVRAGPPPAPPAPPLPAVPVGAYGRRPVPNPETARAYENPEIDGAYTDRELRAAPFAPPERPTRRMRWFGAVQYFIAFVAFGLAAGALWFAGKGFSHFELAVVLSLMLVSGALGTSGSIDFWGLRE